MLALLGLALVAAPFVLAWALIRLHRRGNAVVARERVAARRAVTFDPAAAHRGNAADWALVARVQRGAGMLHAAAVSDQLAAYHRDQARAAG